MKAKDYGKGMRKSAEKCFAAGGAAKPVKLALGGSGKVRKGQAKLPKKGR